MKKSMWFAVVVCMAVGLCAGRAAAAPGVITTVAGNGTYGFSGDGGQATSASLNDPYSVVVDGSGNLYIVDNSICCIRKVSSSGVITTVAGNGLNGYSGDGGQATSASMSSPMSVSVDGSGNLYIADQHDQRIRKVSSSGVITTVAGNGTQGYSGDGGQATFASLFNPYRVFVDGSGNLYIADINNWRIRKVSSSGVITTVAGNGTAGYSGDGGQATSASLYYPYGVFVDGSGNLYIADTANLRIRKVEGQPTLVYQPPALTVPGAQIVNEGQALSFTVSATDPDAGQTVTIMATGLPSGATLSNGTFSWTPTYNQSGSYTVTFTATDNGTPPLSVQRTVQITVNDVNYVPSLAQGGIWETKAPMPTARTSVATGVIAGRLYVATGANTTVVEVYDPALNTWTQRAPIPTNRAYASAEGIDGKLYVVGGCINSDCRIGVTNRLEAYDPATNTWTTKTPMPTARAAVATGVIAGRLYVVGGHQALPLNTLEVYDPATNTWTTRASMPTARAYMGSAVINGKLYVVGGVTNNGTSLATLVVYDPSTDAWTTKSPMPAPRVGLGAGQVNGILYAVSGHLADGTYVNTVEAYDPATDTWTTVAPIPTARYFSKPQGINGVLYVAGNGPGNTAISTLEAFTPTVTVTPVNDAPSFVKGVDQTVLEDSGPHSVSGWATAISAGPADEAGQTLNFIVSNDNNAMFSAQPSVSSAGTLAFTPSLNANGSATVTVQVHDDGGTANGGVNTSASQMFTITVTPVNDAPSFVKGAGQTVLEDAGVQAVPGWATGISAGPSDESGQAVDFVVSNDNNTLFLVQPSVGPTGTLTFTPAPNVNGSATVAVKVHDDGGIANGGADTSPEQTFAINVTPVNDAPRFAKGADQKILWNAGPQAVPGWATGISAGPSDESGQTLNFVVTNNSNGLFSSQPAVDLTGKLTYTTAPNASGVATVTVVLKDDGGTSNGGKDTSASQTFAITVQSTADATQDVLGTVQNLISSGALDAGTGTALTSTLNAAIASANAGNTTTASNQLSAFINKVSAQSGKKLTTAQANALIAAAQSIMDNIGSKGKKGQALLAKVGDGESVMETALPEALGLEQAYPNPFNPSTTIQYGLPEGANVTLVVYNILGQQVRTLVSGAQGPGHYSVVWDGRDEAGRPAATGVYIYWLQAGAFSQVRKMILAK